MIEMTLIIDKKEEPSDDELKNVQETNSKGDSTFPSSS